MSQDIDIELTCKEWSRFCAIFSNLRNPIKRKDGVSSSNFWACVQHLQQQFYDQNKELHVDALLKLHLMKSSWENFFEVMENLQSPVETFDQNLIADEEFQCVFDKIVNQYNMKYDIYAQMMKRWNLSK